MHKLIGLTCLLLLLSGCQEKAVLPPKPYGVVPSERQLKWHQMEMYAFLHFTTNTFTDKEWGYGDEPESVFNPTDFDADQIIGTLSAAGFKGAILTAKHHDGFCLWPSAYTEHSVKNSPWENGEGDVVKEISDACRTYQLKFGVYLSPWDRNYAGYGQPEYITYYRNQLKELLTNYGNVFEVWWDGANGGDGYYGGARETRTIDRSSYYQWDNLIPLVRELQPGACIFSDAGPDIRWVGNEHGFAQDSCWATYTPLPAKGETKAVAGTTQWQIGETGTQNGKFWMPAEADVSIRPGWFYHPSENDKVKSLKELVEIYFHSVGNGASLNLNIPPDRRGRINPVDSVRLMEFHAWLQEAFDDNLLERAHVTASSIRGGSDKYAAGNIIDDDPETYWATNDGEKGGTVIFQLPGEETFNCFMVQEYIPLGQRVTNFSVDVWQNGEWRPIAKGNTIGYKKLLRFPMVTANKVRLNIEQAMACPVISAAGLFLLPEVQ
ncbi:alpha-L-fucosidase [Prolixibacter bellariivorans]|nr:alpha-L-fucosidase [Prolixibacter bellariivorans]